jgi:hydroxymethylpyrimidine/phosphomethylpyrimidine kinase
MRTPVPEKLLAITEEIDTRGFANLTRLTVLKQWFERPGRLPAFGLWIAKRAAGRKGKTQGAAGALLDEAKAPAVVDPVMVAKGGHPLLPDAAVEAVRRLMIPRAALLTPNAPEAEALTGLEVRDIDGQRRAGEALLNLGARAVLMKGGHVDGPTVIDLLMTTEGETVLEAERIDTRHTHGTGCTLASACAAGLALGRPLEVAAAEAWAYVGEAIRRAPGLGGGHGPLDHGWPVRG